MTSIQVASGYGVGLDQRAACDAALDSVAQELGGAADLAVCFLGAAYAGEARWLAKRLAELARTSVGMTAQGVVAGTRELERPDAVSVWAARMPGVTATPLRYPVPDETGAGKALGWPHIPDDAVGVLALCDPLSFPAGAYLHWLRQATPQVRVSGGLASASNMPGSNVLLLDGEVYGDGAVAVALGGQVRLRHLVSQGCRPVGPAFVVTAAQRNLVAELAGRPPTERLREVFAAADPVDQQLLGTGLHLGVVLDEYAEDPGCGDFLVRGVLGAHPDTGALAVTDVVRTGQTVRFHVRDAASADTDLCALLSEVASKEPAGGLLFTCTGRGQRLFGYGDHDAGLITAALDGAPLAGCFTAGEFGPIGDRSWLHSFTATLVVVEASRDEDLP